MRLNQYTRSMALPLLAFLTVVLPCTAWGQSAQASQQTQPGASTSPADPLKRETPYGTVTGFLKAAGQGNYELAASYLQLPRRKPSARDETTARELEAILNHNYFGNLDLISRDPEGNLTDGLPPDRESIGKARTVGGLTLDIELVRVSDPQAGKIWLISADTVRQVPDFYERMPFTALQKTPAGLAEPNRVFFPDGSGTGALFCSLSRWPGFWPDWSFSQSVGVPGVI